MTRYPDPKAKTVNIIVNSKDETDRKLIRYFKEVCRRDGLEMRKEILSLLEHEWKAKHPPPGNPQIQIVQFDGSKKTRKLCEWPKCKQKAEYECQSAFPFGVDKNYCLVHRKHAEYKRDIVNWKKV